MEEREGDRLFGTRVERLDAIAHRLRVRARHEQIHGRSAVGRRIEGRLVVGAARQRKRVQLTAAQVIETAVADNRRQPCERLALGGNIGTGVLPDAHIGFLKNLLRRRGLSQDTERDGI